MQKLPLRLVQHIQNFGECCDQIALYSINTQYQAQIHVTRIENKSGLLRDKHLKKHKHVKYLTIYRGSWVSDKGIKHLKLHTLDAYNIHTITNRGIRGMRQSLQVLNIAFNDRITDKGIRNHINIHTLNVSNCYNITNDAIKNMKLIELEANSCPGITDNGILEQKDLNHLSVLYNDNVTDDALKHLHLIRLEADGNLSITDAGVIRMKDTLEILNASHNSRITDESVKHMKNLREIWAYGSSGITEKGVCDLNLTELRTINNDGFSYEIVGGKRITKDNYDRADLLHMQGQEIYDQMDYRSDVD